MQQKNHSDLKRLHLKLWVIWGLRFTAYCCQILCRGICDSRVPLRRGVKHHLEQNVYGVRLCHAKRLCWSPFLEPYFMIFLSCLMHDGFPAGAPCRGIATSLLYRRRIEDWTMWTRCGWHHVARDRKIIRLTMLCCSKDLVRQSTIFTDTSIYK